MKIIIQILLLLTINSEILYISYFPSRGPYTILVGPTDDSKYYLYIDQEVQHSIFFDIDYTSEEFLKKEKVQVSNDTELELDLVEKKFFVANYSMPIQFYLLSENDKIEYSNAALSFVRECKDRKKCLLHRLKDDGKISKIEYTFDKAIATEFYDEEAIMYVGGIPNQLLENKNVSRCKIDSASPYWSCRLRGIFFGVTVNEEKYEVNTNIKFNVKNENFQVPSDFVSYFKKEILKNVVGRGWCRYISSPEANGYQCQLRAMNLIPTMHLLIGNVYLSFPSSVFFDLPQKDASDRDYLYLNIEINPNDEWIIGGRFVNYYITRFSYEENSISFYNNDTFLIDTTYNEFTSGALLWAVLTIIICIGGIGLLIYMKYLEKKNGGLLD